MKKYIITEEDLNRLPGTNVTSIFPHTVNPDNVLIHFKVGDGLSCILLEEHKSKGSVRTQKINENSDDIKALEDILYSGIPGQILSYTPAGLEWKYESTGAGCDCSNELEALGHGIQKFEVESYKVDGGNITITFPSDADVKAVAKTLKAFE